MSICSIQLSLSVVLFMRFYRSLNNHCNGEAFVQDLLIERSVAATNNVLLWTRFTKCYFRVSRNILNLAFVRKLFKWKIKNHLQNLAAEIFNFCARFSIKLIPQWIPRKQNYLTDFYSRMNDTDNWSIDNESFNIISNKYGPFSVDRFANNLNKKVNKFNSKYFCPGTSHVNTFTDDRSRDHNWLCPPISWIGSVLRYLILCKARGALLIPIWPSSYYWPVIYPDGDKMVDFVKQYIVIEPFYSAEVHESVSINCYPKFKTLVLNIDCTES